MQLSANRIPSFSLCLPSLCQPSLCASALRARTAAIRKAGIKMRLALFLAGLLAIPPALTAGAAGAAVLAPAGDPEETAIYLRIKSGEPGTCAAFAKDGSAPGRLVTSRLQPNRWGRVHKGTDFGYGRHECLYAMADGRVLRLGRDAGNGPRSRGTYIEIAYDKGPLAGTVQRVYHMAAVFPPFAAKGDDGRLVLCPRGTRIFKGQAYGTVGNTGHCVGRNGGYHAHVELTLPSGRLCDVTRIMDEAWRRSRESDYFLLYQRYSYNLTPERIRLVLGEALRIPGAVEDIRRGAGEPLAGQLSAELARLGQAEGLAKAGQP